MKRCFVSDSVGWARKTFWVHGAGVGEGTKSEKCKNPATNNIVSHSRPPPPQPLRGREKIVRLRSSSPVSCYLLFFVPSLHYRDFFGRKRLHFLPPAQSWVASTLVSRYKECTSGERWFGGIFISFFSFLVDRSKCLALISMSEEGGREEKYPRISPIQETGDEKKIFLNPSNPRHDKEAKKRFRPPKNLSRQQQQEQQLGCAPPRFVSAVKKFRLIHHRLRRGKEGEGRYPTFSRGRVKGEDHAKREGNTP